MAEATRFCEAGGFDVEGYDGGFAFVHLNDQRVFDLNLLAEMEPSGTTPGATSSRRMWTTGMSDSLPQGFP
jgi:hypothetical protein